MKLVYFGSDLFLPCFEYLVREHQVLALYTYHNAEDYFSEYGIVRRARALGIPVHYGDMTQEETVRLFSECGCELFFVAEYDRILKLPRVLPGAGPGFRGVNTHCSLLPRLRGYYPVEAAMERELSVTGVSMHKLTPSPDGGDILLQRSVEITPETDSVDVYLACAAQAERMTRELMAHFEAYWESAAPQTERLPCARRPQGARLTAGKEITRRTALELFRRYNSLLEVELDGTRYYVTGMTAGTQPLDRPVWRLADDLILWRVRDGHLRLNIRPEGGKA